MLKTVVYSSHLGIGDLKKKPVELENIIDKLGQWFLTKRNSIFTQPELSALAKPNTLIEKNGHILESIRYENGHGNYFGITYKQPGFTAEEAIITEIVLRQMQAEIAMHTRLSYIHPDEESRMIRPTRPGNIPLILDAFGGYDGIMPIFNKPTLFTKDQAEYVANYIKSTSGKRHLPAMYVSTTHHDQTLINPADLMKTLYGSAVVLVPQDRIADLAVQEYLQDGFRCYGGAIRCYAPNLKEDGKILLTQESIDRLRRNHKTPAEQLFNLVADNLRREKTNPAMEMSLLKTISLESITRNGRYETEEANAITEMYAEDAKQKEKAMQSLKNHYERLIKELKGQRDFFEGEYNRVAHAYSQLLDRENLRRDLATKKIEFKSLIGVVDSIQNRYGDKLVLDNRIENLIKKSPFQQLDKAYLALEWLATGYMEAMHEGGSAADKKNLDLLCKSYCGFRYVPHYSDIVTENKKNKSDYEMEYGGQMYKLKKHLAINNAHDPTKTLRILFEYIPEDKEKKRAAKVIIGYIGWHPKR